VCTARGAVLPRVRTGGASVTAAQQPKRRNERGALVPHPCYGAGANAVGWRQCLPGSPLPDSPWLLVTTLSPRPGSPPCDLGRGRRGTCWLCCCTTPSTRPRSCTRRTAPSAGPSPRAAMRGCTRTSACCTPRCWRTRGCGARLACACRARPAGAARLAVLAGACWALAPCGTHARPAACPSPAFEAHAGQAAAVQRHWPAAPCQADANTDTILVTTNRL